MHTVYCKYAIHDALHTHSSVNISSHQIKTNILLQTEGTWRMDTYFTRLQAAQYHLYISKIGN